MNKLKISTRTVLAAVLCFSIYTGAFAQKQGVVIHSHNDYWHEFPFYQAYMLHISSIEADVYAVGKDKVLVGHDEKDLATAPSLEKTYITPIVNYFAKNKGTAWSNSKDILQLLIDLKTPAEPTLSRVVKILKKYPAVFDPKVNPYAVRVVISGNSPKPKDFKNYPEFIHFDGRPTIQYTPDQLKRVSLVSVSFNDYSHWNGKGTMLPSEKAKVLDVIHYVHSLHKPLRFWDVPNGPNSWNTFYRIGTDVISTDAIEECCDFFKHYADWTFQLSKPNTATGEKQITKVKILDKATANFGGFDKSQEQLTKRIPVYHPVYTYRKVNQPVKNVILLIGDGMGLAEVCAAETVNNGLSMLQCEYVGLQENSSKDAHTTDSAGAGSALATGQITDNRHISAGTNGEINPSMTDVLYPYGYACGVVTLGDLADATPAVYYGHSVERDSTDMITRGLLDGKLTLLNGSGMKNFTQRKDHVDLLNELRTKAGYRIATSIGEINQQAGKVICVDERMDKAATEPTLGLLSDATKAAIEKLKQSSNKGFFLMVEGAKIDYAGHANSLAGEVLETLSFDKAVADALKFADTDGQTLVIVTADHETGGLSLIDGDRKSGYMTVRYTSNDHTPIMIPVYAYGPGAELFTGVYKNIQIFHKIKKVLNVK